MEIRQFALEDIDEVSRIAYAQLKREAGYVSVIKVKGIEEMRQHFKKSIEQLNGIVGVDNNKVVGYLLYYKPAKNKQTTSCYFRITGYGAVTKDRGKVIAKLFQYLGNLLVTKQKVHFEINIYPHDREVIDLFSFMQFGTQCENGIQNSDEILLETNALVNRRPKEDFIIKEMSKGELEHRWQEVWGLLLSLIEHLKQSPIFYPCAEFTEEVYKAFFLEDSTSVFIAEKEGRLIGVMEANKGSNSIINSSDDCYNVGDIYVLHEYRGKNIAQALLNHASQCLKERGGNLLWVEHGTANPNARCFWNKYFSTYCYTLIRDINPVMKK